MVLISVWRAWRAWGVRAWGLDGDARNAGAVRQVSPAADATTAGELPAPPERPWGCGWFDSSLDLREGLFVIEHDGIDLGLAVELMFDSAVRRPQTTLQASRPVR